MHKRLILIATSGLVAAAFGRFPWARIGLPPAAGAVTGLGILLLILVLYELITTRRIHRSTMWAAPLMGNVAWLQHDVPKWANGGLMLGGTASAVQLDIDDLVWTSTDTYALTVIHPALLRFTGTVTSVSGTTVGITGLPLVPRITRLVDGTIDVEVKTFSPNFVVVADATGITVGDAVSVYDTDVIEQRQVTALAGNVATLASPLSAAPTEFAGYIYQSSVSVPLLVRIAGIKRTGDQKFTITATDYTPDVYTIPVPEATATIPGGGTLGNGGNNVGHPRIGGGGGVVVVSNTGPAFFADTGSTATTNSSGPSAATPSAAIVSASLAVATSGGTTTSTPAAGVADWFGFGSGTSVAGQAVYVPWSAAFSGSVDGAGTITLSISADGGATYIGTQTFAISGASPLAGGTFAAAIPAGTAMANVRFRANSQCVTGATANTAIALSIDSIRSY